MKIDETKMVSKDPDVFLVVEPTYHFFGSSSTKTGCNPIMHVYEKSKIGMDTDIE